MSSMAGGGTPNPKNRNLRPPFEPGNPGGPGNPFGGRVAKFRSALWAASTPDRIQALAEQLWLQALGLFEYEATDSRGMPIVDEKTQKPVMVRMPPCPKARTELLNRLLGRIEPPVDDPLESNPDQEMALDEAVKLLVAAGLGNRVPRALLAPLQSPASSPPPMAPADAPRKVSSTTKPRGKAAGKPASKPAR